MARRVGDEQRAIALFRESLAFRSKQGRTVWTADGLHKLSEGLTLADQPVQAARLFAASVTRQEADDFLPAPGKPG